MDGFHPSSSLQTCLSNYSTHVLLFVPYLIGTLSYGGAHHNSSLAPLVFLVRPAEYHLGDQLTVLPRHSHLLPMLPEAHL